MAAAPEEFLNRALLRQLAGEQLFASGEQCFALGRVRQVRAAEERVSARITGDPPCRVKLWRRSGELHFRCDCEAGQAEKFCKHCVAVGLAWLSRSEQSAPPSSGEPMFDAKESARQSEARRDEERRRLASHLKTLDAARLANLVLEASDYDEILRRRLLLEIIGFVRPRAPRTRAKPSVPQPDFVAYQQLLQEAVRPNGYVDFHAMPDFVQGIEEAIAPLKELLHDGWYDAVIGLTEFALVELDAASDRVDTGDGLLNRVYDELQRLHMDACRAGPSHPLELASRLLHYELEGGLGIFNNAARTYAEILGPVGRAAWRTLLIDEWQQTVGNGVSKRKPAPDRPAMDHRRFQLQALMERMARDSGDVEALLALKQADLEGVYDYMALAEMLASAGRVGEAIDCAEEAAERFPNDPEKSVWRDFLIEAYSQAGRRDDALHLAWEHFRETGELEAWRELKTLVTTHWADEWPQWRDRALGLLRASSQKEQASVHAMPGKLHPDQNRTVELLIEENLYDQAWEMAREEGCREDLWLRLAALRESEHPHDALIVYQRHVDGLLAGRAHGNYREVMDWLERIQSLFRQLQRSHEYDLYRLALRSAHRQKRGFVRLLDNSAN